MQIIFESSDPQAAELRTLTERRVRQALKRLDWLTLAYGCTRRISMARVAALTSVAEPK